MVDTHTVTNIVACNCQSVLDALMRHVSGENGLPLTLLVKQDSQRIAKSMTRHSCSLDCLTSSSAGMSTLVRFLLTDPKMTTPPSKRYTLRGVVLVTITQSL